MEKNALIASISTALLLSAGVARAQDAPSAKDQADVKVLMSQLQTLKQSYAQEVRRLRELDVQVQALQARLSGVATGEALPAQAAPDESAPQPTGAAAATAATATAANAASNAGEGAASASTQAGTMAEAKKAQEVPEKRSLQDALLQEHALFNGKLTIENGLSYNRYDRKLLTLNGFLALDAIFLGNIAIENVESDSLTYDLAARYGVTPRLTLNMDIPYVGRRTVYQKGGAGGSAAAIAEEINSGNGIGDLTFSGSYRLLPETPSRPDTVLTLGVTAPTGRAPYGIDWRVIERDNDQYIRFAVPSQTPTGNGVWQASAGLSVVKTMDPALVFGNIGYMHSFDNSFNDIDTSPDTRTPGDVSLGDSVYFGAGLAFAFNERTSMSMAFNGRISGKAELRAKGGSWAKVIGSDANAGTFNMGLTYAMSQHTTLVTQLGIGMTPDAPDYTLTFKVPYMF